MGPRAGQKTRMQGLKLGYVLVQGVFNMVSGGEVASGRQGSSPAVKLPLGLGEAMECG